MHLQPERTGDGCRIDASLLPPCRFIAKAVDLAMMAAAERHRELVAHPAAKRRVLDEV
jgi:hypothetical protein